MITHPNIKAELDRNLLLKELMPLIYLSIVSVLIWRYINQLVHSLISIIVELEYKFHQILKEIFTYFKVNYTDLYPLFSINDDNDGIEDDELYLSLSRPLYLRNYQRKSFIKEVEEVVRNFKP